jgi:hypothetical protein
MKNEITELFRWPHKLGHYLGYNKLLPIHSKWIRNFWLSPGDYVLQAHRNAYKTTAVIVVGYIWFSFLYPNKPVLLIREESKNAERTVRIISEILQSEKVKALYFHGLGVEDFHLVKNNADSIVLSTKTRTTIEGSLDAVGIGSSLVGRHYPVIIGDDIVTIKDRISRASREHKKLFIMELGNIKTAEGRMSISGTPWHKADAFSILPEPDRFPLGTIDIPELTAEKVNDIRQRTTASLFAANYLLQHVSDENRIFPDPGYEHFPAVAPVAWLDPAYSGKNTTALVLVDQVAGRLHVKGYAWRQDVTELYEKIVAIMRQYNGGTLYVESNADKGLSARDLGALYPAVTPRNERENKHNKIVGWAKKYWPEMVFDYDCQADFLNQVLDYEEGQEPDDAPDCLASMIRELKQYEVDENDEATGGHIVAPEWTA